MSEIANGSKVQDFTEDIKLHEAEEPWRPSFKLKRSSEADYEISVEKKLKRNALSILNKITPEKFELLLKQLQKLDIKDEQTLDVLICLIYEKAVREPIYNETYVKMCKFLAPIKVSSTNFIAEDFHSLFVSKCLKEFENALLDQRKLIDKFYFLTESDDQEKRKQEIREEQYKIKHRLLGNVKLLGELSNQNLLLESDVHNCLKKLWCEENEVLLEALCLLLTIAGEKLMKGKNTVYISEIEEIFQKLQNIFDKHLTCCRIRFIIQDVIELKKSNWIFRRMENLPKTIKEIHREARYEVGETGTARHEVSATVTTFYEISETGTTLYEVAAPRNKITRGNQNRRDQVETKSKHLIEDFFENKNLDPICQYVSLLHPNCVRDFIKSSICLVLEERPQNIDSVGELLFHLVKQKYVKINQCKDGLSDVLGKCKTLVMDNPLVWSNVGEILYPLAVKNELHILKILLKPHVFSDFAEKLVSGVFRSIARKEGSQRAKILWDVLKEELEVTNYDFNIDDVFI